jgi:O-antigen ligase
VTLLAILGPMLVQPQVVPPVVRGWVIASATLLALVGAVALVRPWRLLGGLTALLAALVVMAWVRTPPSPEALSHFAGVGIGLLSMNAMAWLCPSETRITIAASLFLLLGSVVLTLGLLNTAIPVAKLAPYLFSESARLEYLYRSSTVSVAEVLSDILKGRLPFLTPLVHVFGPARGGVNANALAGTALLIAPIAWSLTLSPRRFNSPPAKLRVVGGFTAALASGVILITQSRAAWLVAGLTILVFVFRFPLHRRRRWTLGAAVVLMVVALVVALSVFGGRVAVKQAWDDGRASLLQRSEIWRQALSNISQAPWTGVGLNQFRHIYKPPPGALQYDVAHAHNIWLQTALDVGVVGLVAYVCLIALLLTRADRAARAGTGFVARVAGGAGLSLVAVHLFGIADAVSLGAKVGLFQWLACGLILAAYENVEDAEGVRSFQIDAAQR